MLSENNLTTRTYATMYCYFCVNKQVTTPVFFQYATQIKKLCHENRDVLGSKLLQIKTSILQIKKVPLFKHKMLVEH